MQATAEFVSVNNSHPLYGQVCQLFKEVIEPIYGDQQDALDKIGKGKDRTCEVLVEAQKIIGLVVYKIFPTQEFANLGAPNALELKTLFVVDATQNSGRGLGSKLIARVEEAAKSSDFSCIVVTVSATKQDSRAFFAKKQFKQIAEYPNKFNSPEFVLAKYKV